MPTAMLSLRLAPQTQIAQKEQALASSTRAILWGLENNRLLAEVRERGKGKGEKE
jgi:hypothetical protein